MGGLWSIPAPTPDDRMRQTMAQLRLSDKDLQTLWRKFSKCDDDKSGSIDRNEFYLSIDEQHSELGDAIFALIDEDNSGQLDFSEYVEALGKFCLLNKEDMLKFCFNIFDEDRGGTIEGTELSRLLEMLHSDTPASNIQTAMQQFDMNSDGRIDFAEFKQLHALFPSLLYPAFRIQQNMRIYTMGEDWWEKKIVELHTEHKLLQEESTRKTLLENEEEREKFRKMKRQEQAIRIKMGFCCYFLCPCRRHKYVVDEQFDGSESSSEDYSSDDEVSKPKRKVKKRQENVVPIGPRRPLTQEERLERAKKRRMKDMQERPKRKD